jgi:transcriptional regulator with XRE-family HTH domain/predicted negative regulator of RcsB-dependent stress response
MDPRLAELSRTIDATELGHRIKNARIAAHMTQAQLVADDVSAAYLSRIEDGQRRPEFGLLERLAQRLGVTLESLLVDAGPDEVRKLRIGLDHAELALAGGDPKEALRLLRAEFDDVKVSTHPDIYWDARLLHSLALEGTGDLNGAIVILEELAVDPKPEVRWLKALIALSRCHRDNADFSASIQAGERAYSAIDELGLAGLTEAIQLTVTVAGSYFRRGDLDKAMQICLRAIADAERFDSPVGMASAYWNASVIETAAHGATATAVDMANKALALFQLGEDNRNLAKVRAEVASMQLAMDPPRPDEALVTLEAAERELSWSGASTWELALVHLTRARAHMLRGDLGEAERAADLGAEMAPSNAVLLHAKAATIRGQVAAQAGDAEAARARYRDAIFALSSAGADRDVAQLWFELADHLTAVGDTEGALEAFRSAGASTGLRVPGAAAFR